MAINAFEGLITLKIEETKLKDKGYRNIQNFITMIYFHLGGLNLRACSES